jgi:hypothetical protein
MTQLRLLNLSDPFTPIVWAWLDGHEIDLGMNTEITRQVTSLCVGQCVSFMYMYDSTISSC